MHRTLALLGLALLSVPVLLSVGCGGGDDGPTAPTTTPPLVSGDIDGGGGELIDDDVRLFVPGGALDETTGLAIYAENGDASLAADPAPVYRISGLPSELGAPVTLRFRHGLALEAGDTLTCFLGEERQAYSDGSGLSWRRAAGRDSSGWAIVEMPRGAVDLGTKAEGDGDVKATAAAKWKWLATDKEHFELGYDSDQVPREAAGEMLQMFDQMHTVFTGWGFDFGDDDSIWPLDVYLREPVVSIACYVTAPHGKGHFDIHPGFALTEDISPLPIVAHEMFHCVQTFYDPRDPEKWGVLNQERLWLDEATASWLESVTDEAEGDYPFGLDDDNYAALLAGIAGHSDLKNASYGYGMVHFIKYFVENANENDGEELLVDLFEHFESHGDATDAIDAVFTPPVASWCVDMQRKWALNGFFSLYQVNWFWAQWIYDDFLDATTGSSGIAYAEVPDLGADLCKFILEGDAPEAMTSLRIETRPVGAGLTPEELPITVYGRALNSGLTEITTGTDNVLVEDWPALHGAYEDILVMVSRPYSTAAGHTGSREISVTATVVPDLSWIDVTTFDGMNIEVVAVAEISNASSIISNHRLMVSSYEAWWDGSGLTYVSSDDTIRVAVNPETLTLGNWYGVRRGDTGGGWKETRLGGRGVALDSWDEDSLIYRIRGAQTCNYLTHYHEIKALDSNTPPYSEVLSYSCQDSEYYLDQSNIYVHLYRRSTTNSEEK